MSFTKTIFSALLLTFFMFSNDVSAQLTVTSEGNVGIGTTSASAYKLRVHNTTETYATYNGNSYNTTSSKYGLYNYTGSQGTGTAYGLYNTTYQNSGSTNQTRGMYSYVYNPGSGTSYGLYSNVSGSGSGTKYGVYSTIGGGSGFAGYFVGDVHITGSISLMAPTPTQTQKMASVNNAVAKIKGLSALTYTNEKSRTQYTLDVDALKNSLPELVYEVEKPAAEQELIEGEMPAEMTGKAATTTTTSIDYNGLIPVLVEAIKEQQAQIEKLQSELDSIKK